MKKKIDHKQELEELAPHLKQLLDKERAEAQLPKDYFANFEARLQQRLETERSLEPSPTSPKVHPLVAWWQARWRPALALALPAFLLLLWFGLAPKEALVEEPDFALVSSQEIDTYLEQNIEEVTTEELVALAGSEVLEDWQETLLVTLPENEEETPSASENSLEKALESTQSEDLLDELTTEDLSIEEDWF